MFALLDELAPRRRQLQHAQGVACRRRIEDDVVVATGNGFIGEEIGELVEGGDFYGTRTGQLFFHVAQGRFRQEAAIGPDDAFPIGQFHGKDVLQIRCRVGTDEQDLLTGIDQGDGRGTGDGRLADAALAGQEEVFRLDDVKGIVEDHLQSPPQQHDGLSGSAGVSPQQQLAGSKPMRLANSSFVG